MKDSVRRLAMVLRIDDVGISVYEATGAPDDTDEPPAEAFFTSASVICPPVPVPFMPVILTPLSIASLTAAALAFGILSNADCSFPLGPVSSGTGAGSDF